MALIRAVLFSDLQEWDHGQGRKFQHAFDVTFVAKSRILGLQHKHNRKPQCQSTHKSAHSKNGSVWISWFLGQARWIQYAKLFALLTFFKIRRHFRISLFPQKFVVSIGGSLIVTRQSFVLLANRWR